MVANTYLFPSSFISCFPQNNEKKPISLFEGLKDLQELSALLISEKCSIEKWTEWKSEIKNFISDHAKNLDELDSFFSKIISWGVERDLEKTLSILGDIVDLEILTSTIQHKQKNSEIPFHNAYAWAKKNAPLCPIPQKATIQSNCLKEWKKFKLTVINFIPNLINIFLGAFNFLDPQKKYTTLWEKYLILEIVYKFFSIPCRLIEVFRPMFLVSTKVYLATAGVIASTGILIYAYVRWFKPLPDEIVNCANLDKLMEKGVIEPKVGQSKELNSLIEALEGDANVLLVGQSGEGKTALMHHLIMLKHEQELSKKLQKLNYREVDCSLIMSSDHGHGELINQIKNQIDQNEENVLLFFDEFYQVVLKSGAFQTFKKRFLEDKPQSKFVATISSKQYEKLKEIDFDSSFRIRVDIINVHTSSEEQNRLIIQDYIERKAKDIPISSKAIDAILEISKKKDFLPGNGRPAKAIKILTDAIGRCRSVYNPHFMTSELSELGQKYKSLQLQAVQEVKASVQLLDESEKLKTQIKTANKALKQNKENISKIKELVVQQQKMKSEYYYLTHLIAQTHSKTSTGFLKKSLIEELDVEEDNHIEQEQASAKKISEKDQILYLWHYFYTLDAVKNLLSQTIQKVAPPDAKFPTLLPVQLDEKLVYHVYEETIKIEKSISEANLAF